MRAFIILSAAVLAAYFPVLADAPKLITFQGRLTDSVGNAVPDSSYSVTFRIYSTPTGGSPLWSELQTVSTVEGLFSILLGSASAFPASLFDDTTRYLAIQVASEPEMTPRQRLGSVGYGLASAQWSSSGNNVFRSTGNVGIGASNPDLKLTVNGHSRIGEKGVFTGGAANYGKALVFSGAGGLFSSWSGDNSDPLWLARFNKGKDSSELRMVIGDNPNANDGGGDRFVVGTCDGDPEFDTACTFSPILTVQNTGNVGIGSASPTERLHVVGNICATGTIGACSDARFKKSVRNVEGALEIIAKLRGVRYEWDRDHYPNYGFASGSQLGFIAQDVRKVLPEVVAEGSDGALSVDYGRFSAVLLEAIKEQQQQIELLSQKIRLLEEGPRK